MLTQHWPARRLVLANRLPTECLAEGKSEGQTSPATLSPPEVGTSRCMFGL